MKKILSFATVLLFFASTAFSQGLAIGWENGVSVKSMVGAGGVQGTVRFSNYSYEDDRESEQKFIIDE